jgi:DNA repair protein RadC
MTTSPFRLNEATGHYDTQRPVSSRDIIEQARKILADRFERKADVADPAEAKEYLITQLAWLEHEVFACLFLDNRHRVIAFKRLFRGTIDGCTVHPREVVKTALLLNAAAVIFAHNHPSGDPSPSQADRTITQRLKDALALIDVRVLDHIVVGGTCSLSLAEQGLL